MAAESQCKPQGEGADQGAAPPMKDRSGQKETSCEGMHCGPLDRGCAPITPRGGRNAHLPSLFLTIKTSRSLRHTNLCALQPDLKTTQSIHR